MLRSAAAPNQESNYIIWMTITRSVTTSQSGPCAASGHSYNESFATELLRGANACLRL